MGKRWHRERSTFGTDNVRAICKDPTRKGVLFASQYGTIFRSQDSGRTWEPIQSTDDGGGTIRGLVILPESPDQLFVLIQGRGVYVARPAYD